MLPVAHTPDGPALNHAKGASRGDRLRKACKSHDFYGFCPIDMPFYGYRTKLV
jgi:hypothetical protein